jgi:hypothetical protein
MLMLNNSSRILPQFSNSTVLSRGAHAMSGNAEEMIRHSYFTSVRRYISRFMYSVV